MFRLLKGFGVTLNYFRKKNITIQYPEEKLVMPERFRGIHRFFPEKCIVCNLCVQACPTDVITLTGKPSEENPKKKVIDTYNIDFQGCILCDFCTEVCPTSAIVMTARYDNLSEFNRADHFKDIEWLTNNTVYGNYMDPEEEERLKKEKEEQKRKAAEERKKKEEAEAKEEKDASSEGGGTATATAAKTDTEQETKTSSKPETAEKTEETPAEASEEKAAPKTDGTPEEKAASDEDNTAQRGDNQ